MPFSSRIPRTRLASLGAALLFGLSLSACSGGGDAVSSLPQGGGTPSSAQTAARESVTFTMHWNSATPAASTRRPAYVPATARSVSVAVDGGTARYLNFPATSLTIDAPVGTDTFVFTTYDVQNGLGNVLSTANVTQAIVAGTANTVSATLNGVVAATKIALDTPAPNAGAPATANVKVSALDADGNVIVGAGDYSQPILLSVTIPATSEAGAVTLSTNEIVNPSQTATLAYTGATLTTATVLAASTGIASSSAVFAPTPTFYEYALPVGTTGRPLWIAAGSDGNMWFTQTDGTIGRIAKTGVITYFTPPTTGAIPAQIIAASDGNLWFTEYAPATMASKIAKLTTTGTFTEFSTLFAPPPQDTPQGLVDRGDGTIWYVAEGSSRVGFQGMTSGVAGETSVPTANAAPFGIATAPDNNLYYTEALTDKIGRITNLFTTQSEVALTAGTEPESIVRGPDGNLWFTETGKNKIGRLSPNTFTVTNEYPTVTPNSVPVGIVVGRDGALWFTETGLDRIGRITTAGIVTEYASPVAGLALKGIAVAADGSLYFCQTGIGLNPGSIGKLVY